ncbi:Uncharacterised protein [uncultured Ruminococcus sp.]|nr:Uncharacterised protein [uncultured Clostridium sp.]SCH77464.1 Uncharacterised protein [uncultured Ruminococcus sp.]
MKENSVFFVVIYYYDYIDVVCINILMCYYFKAERVKILI